GTGDQPCCPDDQQQSPNHHSRLPKGALTSRTGLRGRIRLHLATARHGQPPASPNSVTTSCALRPCRKTTLSLYLYRHYKGVAMSTTQQVPTLTSEETSIHPPKRLLFGPGPTQVHPRVYQAMAQPIVGHLDP